MIAQHTKGPWKVFTVQSGPNQGQLLGIGQETGEGVADAHGGLWGSGSEQMANAHLVAAAPELLAAAKRALAVLKASGESVRPGNALGALDAAIAKATGGPS